MGLFSKNSREKAIENKIDKGTEELLDLETHKKRLQLEVEEIQLELQNQRSRSQMELERAKHTHQLELDSQKAVFEREKAIWEKDKADLIASHERDMEEFKESLKREHDLKLQEAVTLTKLESQQKIKQAELDKDREITKLEKEQSKALSELRAKTAEEQFGKFKEIFEEFQMNGDKNSKFIQDLSMKMIENLPTAATRTQVDVGVGDRLLEAKASSKES